MEDNIKKIREACIAANPSIKDLVFGCEVKTPYGNITKLVWETRGKSIWLTEEDSRYNLEDLEIIGRPIRLADVLLAIQKKQHKNITYLVSTFGIFMDSHFNFSMKHQWNLLKDDLTLQSPETISFILELLSSN